MPRDPHHHDDHEHDHAHAAHDHSAHAHGHSGHAHAPSSYGRAFAVGMAIQSVFIVFEVTYGLVAHSLALLADAGHNVSDVLGLGLAWGAAVLAKRRPTKKRTYGMRRFTILVALFNSLSLMFVTGGVAWESIRRLMHPMADVGSKEIIVIAALGVGVNGGAAWLFLSGRKSDANVGAAFLHLASDAAISLGVAAAGVVILYTRWMWLDPVVGIALSLAVLASTWSLLQRATNLALDAVPEGIELDELRAFLLAFPCVLEVHDLHVWAMSTTENLLTTHLVVGDSVDDSFATDVCEEIRKRYGIGHSTVQIERRQGAHCRLAPEGLV